MKKSLSRLLSLALVLVMVVGMMPMALATEGGSSGENSEGGYTIDVTGLGEKYYVGDTINVSLTGLTDCTINNIVWAFDGDEGTDPNHTYLAALNTGANPNVWSGTTVVTYTPNGATESETANVSFSTTVYSRVESITVDDAAVAVKAGEEVTFQAVVAPATAVQDVTWEVIGDNAADASISAAGVFAATKAGMYNVKATSVDDPTKSDTATITVDALTLDDIVPALNKTEVTLNVAQTETLTVSYTPVTPAAQDVKVEWKSSNDKIATVDKNGKITAVAQGVCEITAKVTLGTLTPVELKATVTVADGAYIVCEGVSLKSGGSEYLDVKTVGVPADAKVYYMFAESSSGITINDEGKVHGSSVGIYPIEVSAYYVPYGETPVEANRIALDKITVYASVYSDHTIDVVLKEDAPSTFKFTTEKIFSSAKYDNLTINADKSLKYLLTEDKGYEIAFVEDYASDDIGVWYTDSTYKDRDPVALANLGRASITLNGKSGTMILNYIIYSEAKYGKLIVATGELKISTEGTAADITYKTSFSNKVTVDETDFNTFFKASKATGSLDYVMFDISTTSPKEGYLYTNVAANATKDLADSRDEFYYNYVTSDGGYDLDTLTYVPDSRATKAYTDVVSFTCYSTTGAKVSGILAFEVGNDMTFTDVKESDYFYDAVVWAVGEGITTGTSATTFSPNNACTRGQVVTFLWRAAGEPTPKRSVNPFTDVKKSDYYYEAVLWAVGEGITTGLSATTFGPNQACTRAQVVTFLYRAFNEPSIGNSTESFADVKSSDYYYEAVIWAVKNGVTTGLSSTSFGPSNACTRGQIVTFLYRAYED